MVIQIRTVVHIACCIGLCLCWTNTDRCFSRVYMQNRPDERPEPSDKYSAAVERIAQYQLSNVGFGGPVRVVKHNDITLAIVACGPDITPYLVANLHRSNYAESVCIVFCLTDLKAVEARDAIDKLLHDLRGKQRFPTHDMTLEMLIKQYYKSVCGR